MGLQVVPATLVLTLCFDVFFCALAQPQPGAPWPMRSCDAQHSSRSAYGGASSSWTFKAGGGIQSTPAIGSDGCVVFGCYDGKVYALEGETGLLRWKYQTGGQIWSSPAIDANGSVFIGSDDRNVYSLNSSSGELRWTFLTGDKVYSSPAVGVGGIIYVGSFDSRVYALNGTSGAVVWSFLTGGQVWSSPTLGQDGTVYVGSIDNKLYALNGLTGAVRWQFATGGGIPGSVALDPNDGTVFIGSQDRYMYVLNGATGSMYLRYVVDGVFFGSPGFSPAGNVFIGNADGGLYSFDSNNGRLQWSFASGGQVNSNPASSANMSVVYVSNDNNILFALRTDTGRLLWSFLAYGFMTSPTLASDGTIYIGSNDKTLYAITGARPGYYWSGAYVSDAPCGTGRYCAGRFADPALCPVGTYGPTVTAVDVASGCLPCSPGSYGPNAGLAVCVACGAGTYNPLYSATSPAACVLCPLGSISVGSNNERCIACGVGTYADTLGSRACAPCPAGTFLDAVGAITASNCTPCPAGRYNPAPGQGFSSCLSCPPGSASALPGLDAIDGCAPCAPGNYSAGGAAICSLCAPGSFSASPSSSSCQLCPRGTFNPRTGAASSDACLPCPVGETTFFPGAEMLSDCVAAVYACPSGTQPAQPGVTPRTATDCAPLSCGPGTQVAGDGSGCAGCSPGAFFSFTTSSCVPCSTAGADVTCVGIVAAPLYSSPDAWASALIAQSAAASTAAATRAGDPNVGAVIADLASSISAGTLLAPPGISTQPPDPTLLTVVPPAVIATTVALLVAVVWFLQARMPRLTSILRKLDSYSTNHSYDDLEFVQIRSTELGGACSLLAMGVIAALAANLIAQRVEFNTLFQSNLLPVGASTVSDAMSSTPVKGSTVRSGWPPFAGLQIVIGAQGQVAGDCTLNNSTAGTAAMTGLAMGSSVLSSISSGSTTINFISCPSCVFSGNSELVVYLPYSCQNVLLGVSTTTVTGEVQLQSVAMSPIQGQLQSALTWQVTPLLQTLLDVRSTAPGRGRGTDAFKGALSFAVPTTIDSTTTLVPNAAALTIRVDLSASQLYTSVTIQQLQSPVQLLSAILSLAGVLGSFAMVFSTTEDLCTRFRQRRRCRSAKAKASLTKSTTVGSLAVTDNDSSLLSLNPLVGTLAGGNDAASTNSTVAVALTADGDTSSKRRSARVSQLGAPVSIELSSRDSSPLSSRPSLLPHAMQPMSVRRTVRAPLATWAEGSASDSMAS